MGNTKQTYKYKIKGSILSKGQDEYTLSKNEYYCLYSFFVTYSMCGSQSAKKRTFMDYGWHENNIKNTELGIALSEVLNLNRNSDFTFTVRDDLSVQFNKCNLKDGFLVDVDCERAVIGITRGSNNYLRLFYRVRNGLAHGRFNLRFSSKNEKMVVIQDNDKDNVTARIVIKLNTLLKFIKAIDINGIILWEA